MKCEDELEKEMNGDKITIRGLERKWREREKRHKKGRKREEELKIKK